MNDGNRVYPVNKLIMHHAVSDDMVNWDDLAVQDWFSNIGKDRGYQGGAVYPYHEHPGRPGQVTYSMAHYCLHRYTKDGNKYGWRLTELIKDPFQQVAWHCGNWPANQTSIGIETAGNFSTQDLDDKALMLVADALGRGWDQELVEAGYPSGVNVYGHKDWFATACPGKIYDELDKLIDMINNPSKWENILWPPAPQPEPQPEPTQPEWTALPQPAVKRAKETANVIDLDSGQAIGTPITQGKDTEFLDTKYYNGVTYLRSKWSRDHSKNWGVDIRSLEDIPVEQPPVEEPPVEEPPVEEPPVEQPPVEQPPTEEPNEPGDEDVEKEKNAKVEAAKVVGRNGVLVAVSAFLAALTDWLLFAIMGVNAPDAVLVSFGGLLYAGSLYADKVIHEQSKKLETKVTGLVGF